MYYHTIYTTGKKDFIRDMCFAELFFFLPLPLLFISNTNIGITYANLTKSKVYLLIFSQFGPLLNLIKNKKLQNQIR